MFQYKKTGPAALLMLACVLVLTVIFYFEDRTTNRYRQIATMALSADRYQLTERLQTYASPPSDMVEFLHCSHGTRFIFAAEAFDEAGVPGRVAVCINPPNNDPIINFAPR